MSATPFLEQIIHIVAQFLQKSGHKDLASQLLSTNSLPDWCQHNNPLIKKGLVRIIKDYVKMNQNILHYYQNRSPESDDQSEPEVPLTKKSKKSKLHQECSPKIQTRANSPKPASSWMNKFEQPKRLEQLNSPRPLQVQPRTKSNVDNQKITTDNNKKVPNKHQQILSSDYESENDSFQLEPKKKLKKDAKQQKKQIKVENKKNHIEKKKDEKVKQKIHRQQNQEEKQQIQIEKSINEPKINHNIGEETYSSRNKHHKGPLKFFSRIDPSKVGIIKSQLRDNSFQAKAKYGQGNDDWGVHGYERLKDTRGDSFKKTKGKLKNKAFQGAMMDINKINSIPID